MHNKHSNRIGWVERKVREVVSDVVAGVSLNGDDRPVLPDEIGVLKVSSVTGDRFDPKEHKALRSDESRVAGVIPVANDIIMTRANGSADLVGRCVRVPATFANLRLPDKLWKIVPNASAGISPRWLYHLLASDGFRRRLLIRSSGSSGMRNISKPSLLDMTFNCPPLEYQESTADALDLLDRARRCAAELIGAKLALRRGLMQQLLTGRRRLLAFADQPWEEMRLGDIFTERNETGRADLPLLSITGTRGVIPREKIERKDTSNADKSAYKRIARGDIGYNTMRMWQGVSALSELEGIVSPAYTICIPTSAIIGAYVRWFFKFPPTIHLFFRYSQGLVDDTLSLKFPHFAEIKVRIPTNVDEQRAIADVLETAQREIDLLKQLRDQIQQQKRGLMQKLLTGQIPVQTSVAHTEPERSVS